MDSKLNDICFYELTNKPLEHTPPVISEDSLHNHLEICSEGLLVRCWIVGIAKYFPNFCVPPNLYFRPRTPDILTATHDKGTLQLNDLRWPEFLSFCGGIYQGIVGCTPTNVPLWEIPI